ncbi:winged helix DNA-binding protein [Blastomonas sp.]|uniref:winged helix DNA-binding protein n=1 Tax=Blastomonas sp. TaxID=1909299 RepID=UPI00391A2C34
MRLILQEQQASRLRSSCFAGLKLRNPAWDMLVALLAAKRNGSQLSMSDLCLMCDAPESTALRLIHQLREKGYAEMVPDRSDRRRTRVSLTSMGEMEFDSYLDKLDQV